MPFQRGQYGINRSHRIPFVKLTHVHIQCKDEEGNPMAGRRYRLVPPRGEAIEGELDDQGWAKHEGLYPGEVIFALFPQGELLTPVEQQGGPPVYHLRLRFEDEDGQPFVNKPFEITAGQHTVEGHTDERGKLIADVPAGAEEGEITIWLDEDKSGESYTWPIRIAEAAR